MERFPIAIRHGTPRPTAETHEWMAAALGDRRWRELLEQHHTIVRRELDRFRGREVDTAGDGFMAAFDGPARAIRCALAIIKAVRQLGLEIRAGIHTGECEEIGGKLGGIAVHIAARVAAAAPPGGVLVSQTVKDLVAGSGIPFEDRGVHRLNVVPTRGGSSPPRAECRGERAGQRQGGSCPGVATPSRT